MHRSVGIFWLMCLSRQFVYSLDHLSCLSTNTLPYVRFSTKTPYSVVSNEDTSLNTPVGCKPVQLWLTARHGTRYPGEEDIHLMSARLPQLRDTILAHIESGRAHFCQQDVDLLRSWTMKFGVDVENNLTPSGGEELFNMASRFSLRFPELLSGPYNRHRHKFATTTKQRAIESARHFARGLFGDEKIELPKARSPDPLLQFYKTCTKWKQQVDDSEAVRTERYSFQNSTTMLDTIGRVSLRLGFTNHNLSYADVKLIYDACRYEKSLHLDKPSTWCVAFSRCDLEVLEFDMDLEYFWTDSYGVPLNYIQACPKVRDFIEKFLAYRNNGQVQSHLHFSHLGGVLKFITRLGLYNASRPLLHTDFRGSHIFSSSNMAAFASNVALVLYECPGEHTEYRVLCLLQEHPTLLPACSSLFCPLDVVLKQYDHVVRGCDVDTFCTAEQIQFVSTVFYSVFTGLLVLVVIYRCCRHSN